MSVQKSGRPIIWFAVYQLLWHLLLPLAFIRLAWRARHSIQYLGHLSERLGFGYTKPTIRDAIWIHAVSVGETRAAQPLIEAYLARGEKILLTHMTLNGRRTGKRLFASAIVTGQIRQVYLPYDLCGPVEHFLKTFKPKLGLFMETEAWPTIVFRCAEIGLPLFLVNARLSQRSAKRVQSFGKAGQALFQAFAGVLAQTAFDAERYQQLGVRNIEVVGNLKFDVPLDSTQLQKGHQWRAKLEAVKRPMVCAASTRDGEEAIILKAWQELLQGNVLTPPPLLCLIPRHPERFADVANLIANMGLTLRKRSEWLDTPDACNGVEVILGDSMGEMAMYYSAASLTVMGGTLLPFGGQNLIEACAAGCPVLLGQHTYNFQQAAIDAIDCGAAKQMKDEALLSEPLALVETLKSCLLNADQLEQMSKAAKQYALDHQGATQSIMTILDRQTHLVN